MIQGFQYAYGPEPDKVLAKPASAFSRGDVLMLDSTSSVSRINEVFASGVDIYGVAECDSNQSREGLVTVALAGDGTVWRASLSTAASACTPGQEFDISFGAPNGRHYVDPASSNSVRAVIVRGNAGPMALDQSVDSQCLVKFIAHASNVELS